MFDRLIPLTTDADVLAMATELVGPAIRRRIWLFFLDDEDRAGMGVAMDGVPVDPAPLDIAMLAARILHHIDEDPEADSVVLVWERPGPAAARMQEADWMAGLAVSGAPIHAQLLSSDDGVRLVDAEFEAITAA